MKLPVRKIYRTIIILLLAVWTGGCSLFDHPDCHNDDNLSLCLHIFSAEPRYPETRDGDNNYTFEPAAYDTEKMNTIRVIIVNHADNKVVHNYFERLASPDLFTKDLLFPVEFNTKYNVYLIANEEGIPDYQDVSQSLKIFPGSNYTVGSLEDIVISASDSGVPFIGNADSPNENSVPIPLTEIYQVKTIEEPEEPNFENNIIQSETFFITRAATKFSFHFFRSADSEWSNYPVESAKKLSIKKIKITGLGRDEYLFPKNTIYNPPKYKEDGKVDNKTDRIITEFKLPDSNVTGDYIFTLPDPIEVSELDETPTNTDNIIPGKNSFVPQLYFTESKGYFTGSTADIGEFQCALSFDGKSYDEDRTVTLPNLPNGLPRNTHVEIIATITPQGFEMEVRVLPYTGVELQPVFGL